MGTRTNLCLSKSVWALLIFAGMAVAGSNMSAAVPDVQPAGSYDRVYGTKHNVGRRGCEFCHNAISGEAIRRDLAGGSDTGTMLCVSCHDGSRHDSPGIRNSHRINVPYKVQYGKLAPQQEIERAGLRLYGPERRMHCGTCHNPHDNANDGFLRVRNDFGTRLCVTCHEDVG